MNLKPLPAHTRLDYFPVRQGKVIAAGVHLDRIVSIAGNTPLYLYDRALISQRVEQLRALLPATIQLHYAIKANPMPALVQHIAGQVDGLDVASRGELLTALNSGIPASEISFAGPGKTDTELLSAIAAGAVINVESENELIRINEIGKNHGLVPGIALRINPDFELKTSGMKMAGGAKPFGIDAEKIPDILKRVASFKLEFHGFHIFSGSQNLQADAIIETHNKTFSLAAELAEQVDPVTAGHFRFINIGGGFGIPYFPGDQPLALQPVAENLKRLMRDYPQFRELQIILELGRYLVGEAGIYVSKIIDKKTSRGEIFLVTDGGLHHHLANSGNFGQVIRKNYPVLIHQQQYRPQLETVNIVGPLCTPLDILAAKASLPAAEPGDYVVILQSGAYGKSASPENFLGHPHVDELLL